MKSIYTKEAIDWVKKQAKKKGAKSVCHIFPRAYCIAKPAPESWLDMDKVPEICNDFKNSGNYNCVNCEHDAGFHK